MLNPSTVGSHDAKGAPKVCGKLNCSGGNQQCALRQVAHFASDPFLH